MTTGIYFSVQYGVPELLVYCFARLDPHLKNNFNELLLGKRLLDKVLWDMVQEGMFPEWFKDKVSFDPLYGQLNGLRLAIAVAVRNLLIEMDGTRCDYHLIDFTSDELATIVEPLNVDEISLRRLASELNRRLQNAG